MGSVLLYTGLGITMTIRRTKVQQAFPNTEKILYHVTELEVIIVEWFLSIIDHGKDLHQAVQVPYVK